MEDILMPGGLLGEVHRAGSFDAKIKTIHKALKEHFDFVDRIAVALYDSQTAMLKTFIHSSGGDNPLSCYECMINEAPSLNMVKESQMPRLINDLNMLKQGHGEHTKKISAQGYNSSYAVPMFDADNFLGIIFFNSYGKNVFNSESLPILNLFAQLINSLVINKLNFIRTMIGSFKSALNLVSYKDPETGNHLERMSRYSRLIARNLARSGKFDLNDEVIENLFLFAPLHDIGKIGIPDNILLKPGKLDKDEWEVMKTHSSKGRDIINAIAENMGLKSFEHIGLLYGISEGHHETIDGEGYPHRLKKSEIAIETQIVTVADIFDALTSKRPYKEAWTNDEAFAELGKLAGAKINEDCVHALIQERAAVEQIQMKFKDRLS